jgi:hypothetical protein
MFRDLAQDEGYNAATRFRRLGLKRSAVYVREPTSTCAV